MPFASERKKQIFIKAISALALKERSRKGLLRKLSQEFNEEGDDKLIASVLRNLETKNYLSDERFARAQVLTKGARYGDRKLKWELLKEGVSREIADDAIRESETSEYDRALVLWKRKFGEPPQDFKEKSKQIRFLAGRGFSFRTIEKVLSCELPDEDY